MRFIGACFLLTLMVSTSMGWQASDSGLDTSAFDQSIRVQDDLFFHVNGTWLRNTEIPEDKSNYGSFGILADQSQIRIREIIEETAKSEHPQGSNAQKIADFYRGFMDEERVESLGGDPLTEELEKIQALESKEEIWRHFGHLSQIGVGSPVGFFVGQDAGQATQYICYFSQSGLSLPDRDYYLKNDEGSRDARRALQTYVKTLFELAEIEDPDSAAERILALEIRMANSFWERVELRNANKIYNKMTLDEFSELTGGKLDWRAYLKSVGVTDEPAEIVVRTPSYFTDLQVIFEQTSKEAWIDYLQFKLISSYASFLSPPFVDAQFELYQKQLAGIPVQRPRWKRGVNAVGRSLGEAVGELYVARYFKPKSKAAMEKLVDNLLKAFGQSIDDLTWMTDETKARAKEKLSKIDPKIGYPNVWRDYSKLVVKPGDLFGNVYRSNVFEHNRNVARLGQPIDREEWGMTPQTVNAYYSPTKNEIVFPAAILQPPFFHIDAPEALNYGGIGAVIGHEISHAFDDQGSRYDGDGNLKNWWTDQDKASFKELTSRLIAQYNDYSPLDGKTVNGKLTLGENIADLSGLEIAHKALTLARQGKPDEKVAGWNSDQLFFVGWSRVWQRKYRDQEMIQRLLTDPHSPSEYRANGPVTNIEAFYKAFDVKPGDGLYKPESERIKIW